MLTLADTISTRKDRNLEWRLGRPVQTLTDEADIPKTVAEMLHMDRVQPVVLKEKDSSTIEITTSTTLRTQDEPSECSPSQFLRLPAELRIRIYGYVLGGNTIHSGTPGSRSDGLRYKMNVCAMTEDDASSPMHNQQIHAFEPVAKRPHEYCTRSTLPPGPLKVPPLLVVSKQVSSESIAVLLGENTFTFHGPKALEIFLSRLPKYQHALIKRVRFYTLNVYDAVWSPYDGLAELLPGLTHLYAWLELNPRGINRMRPRLMEPDQNLASTEYQDRLFEHLDGFRGHKLRYVRIDITVFDDVWELGGFSDVNYDNVNAWAERVRQRLMDRRPLTDQRGSIDAAELPVE